MERPDTKRQTGEQEKVTNDPVDLRQLPLRCWQRKDSGPLEAWTAHIHWGEECVMAKKSKKDKKDKKGKKGKKK
jgi:hypothetical protein